MALTYTQAKAKLDEIATRSETNRLRLARARELLSEAEIDLASMSSTYTTFVGELEAAVAANPTDNAWQGAGAEKDQMVADFLALRTRAVNLIAAVDAVV